MTDTQQQAGTKDRKTSGPTEAFQHALAVPWAMEQHALEEMLTIANREAGDPEAIGEKIRQREKERDPQAIEAKPGRPLDGTARATMRDGVAIVPIAGPLFRYANIFTEISGATSLEIFSQDLIAAVEARDVEAVLLNVDSPGGQVNGTNETAKLIRRLSAESGKPIVAYGSGNVASGAYWLGSAADSLVIEETTRVGSIGVVMGFLDTRKRDEARGVRQVQFVSSNAPDKRPDPDSERGKSVLQAEVDALAQVFVKAVADNRGVSIETVESDFGQGGIVIGTDAVEAGMADAIGSFEEVLAALAAGEDFTGPRRERTSGSANREEGRETMSKETQQAAGPEQKDTPVTVASLKASHPEVYNAIREEAKAEGHKAGVEEGQKAGAESERQRIEGIKTHTPQGYEKLRDECVADGSTVETFCMKLARMQTEEGSQALQQLRQEGEKTAKDAPQPGASESGAGQGAASGQRPSDPEAAKDHDRKVYEASADLQREFGSFDRYHYFQNLQASGRHKSYAGAAPAQAGAS